MCNQLQRSRSGCSTVNSSCRNAYLWGIGGLQGAMRHAPDAMVRRHSGCDGFFNEKQATEPPAWRRKSYEP